LLGRQFKRGDDFGRQVLGFGKSEGIKFNFCDKSVIWDHHSARSKESLEVIGKLRSSSITWIHSDVDCAASVNLKFCAFENECPLFNILNGDLNGEDLLGNN
jgi:hypothetical protein